MIIQILLASISKYSVIAAFQCRVVDKMKSIHHPQTPVENSPSPSKPALKPFSDFASFTLTGRSFQSGTVLFKKKLSLILPTLAGSLWKHTLNCLPVYAYSPGMISLNYISIQYYLTRLKFYKIQSSLPFFAWFQAYLA